jgi:uncharacterized protein YjbI with pentapeptide repeats
MKPWVKNTLYAVAGAIAIVGYAWLLWRGPWWFDGDHLRTKDLQPADGVVITGFRTALIALGAGAITAFGLWYTARNHKLALDQFKQTQDQFQLAQRQFEHTEEQFRHTQIKDSEQSEIAREGQVTQRYVEAIKMLGSKNLTERLGGIYSLERIMRDSEKDHQTIVEVLASLIRIHAPREPDSATPAKHPKEDVQAALTVLGRRPRGRSEGRVNLRGISIRGANLTGSYFARTDFNGSDLSNVRADKATLDRTDFSSVDFSRASLRDASIVGAHFTQAKLHSTKFFDANLSESLFIAARLEGTVFAGADISTSHYLSVSVLLNCLLDERTKVSDDVREDPRMMNRL